MRCTWRERVHLPALAELRRCDDAARPAQARLGREVTREDIEVSMQVRRPPRVRQLKLCRVCF
jgi:hypothetical protein